MDCAEFLENYSDFLDRRLESRALVEYRDHLQSCPSCAAYDRVVQRGLWMVRELPAPEPGADFAPRLQHRVYQALDQLDRREHQLAKVGTLAAMAVAALVIVAWLPALRSNGGALQLPPVVVEAPAPAPASEAGALWKNSVSSSVGTSLLFAPDFPPDPWRASNEGRLLLFRAPLRAPSPPPEPVSEGDAE